MSQLRRGEYHTFTAPAGDGSGDARYLYLVPSAAVVRLDDVSDAVLNLLGDRELSLQDAIGALGPDRDKVMVLGGGQDLLARMKDYVAQPDRVVNIKNALDATIAATPDKSPSRDRSLQEPTRVSYSLAGSDAIISRTAGAFGSIAAAFWRKLYCEDKCCWGTRFQTEPSQWST